VAVCWPCGRFRVALHAGVCAESMPSLWLCGGFGWLPCILPALIGGSSDDRWGMSSVIRSGFPVVAGGFDALVIGIQLRLEQNQGGQTASDVGDFAGLICGQRAAQQTVRAAAQPFLQHLLPANANGVVPDLLRRISPIGRVVEAPQSCGLAVPAACFL
jgi:hypothetical protein